MQPPRLAKALLTTLLAPDHHALIGDFEEEFYDHAEAYGLLRASALYGWRVIETVPVLWFYDLIWHTQMFKNYLTITLRTLWKYKGFSSVNILGMALSMAVSLLIILFIAEQRQADQFHTDAERIYRVQTDLQMRQGVMTFATSPLPIVHYLAENTAAVEHVTPLRKVGTTVMVGERAFGLNGYYVRPAFLDMFDFPLVAGQPTELLQAPNQVVLGEETAQKLFGTTDVVGQTLTVGDGETWTVTGVLRAVEQRSHFEFEALVSFATFENQPNYTDAWQRTVYDSYTYVKLREGAEPTAVQAALEEMAATQFAPLEAYSVSRLVLQPLLEINLGGVVSNELGQVLPIMAVYLLGGMVLVIMLMACFNYIGLSVARSMSRAREVGVRKVVGAYRQQIIGQFLGEAILISVLALALGNVLLWWVLPQFNGLSVIQLANAEISRDLLTDYRIYLVFLLFSLAVGALAGWYPAWRLSSYSPSQVIRGEQALQGGGGSKLRKTLVVVQFACSVGFIATAQVIYQQSEVLLKADYGLQKEHIVNVELHDLNFGIFQAEANRLPGVAGVSGVTHIPATGSRSGFPGTWEGAEEAEVLHYYGIDAAFVENMGLRLLAGRNFDAGQSEEAEQSLLVNAEAVAAWGWGTPEEAIGRTIRTERQVFTVIGVVANFHADELSQPVTPLLLRYMPQHVHFANVRIQPGMEEAVVASLEALWKRLAPHAPFAYAYFADQLANHYAYLEDFTRIIGFVALLAIVIAALGMLGMASYTASLRRREIGIRKVLGAEVKGVFWLLSRQFLVLVGVAIAVGLPLAWLVNQLWLVEFAVRTDFGLGVMVVAALGTIGMALLAIAPQTIRAALVNPVETLRQE